MSELILLLLLAGCSSNDHTQQARVISRNAEALCSCHRGSVNLRITKYSNADDTGYVICGDGVEFGYVERYIYACGNLIK
jgi:hypothetical protein